MPSTNITQQTIASAKATARPGAPQSEITDSRAEGLRLRIGARGVRWQYRCKIRGENLRLDLGSVDEWSIAEARDVAGRAQDLVRAGLRRPDADWLFEQRVRLGKVDAPATPQADPRLSLKWSFDGGKKHYLAHVMATKKSRTFEDYKSVLGTPELERFKGRPLASITLKEMSKAIGDIHARGVQRHAEHVASVVRPMWKWCGHLNNQDDSGLDSPRVMQDLQAPERTKAAVKKKKYVPPFHELGRMLVIARAGVFHPVIAAGMELLLLTSQRVNAVVTAEKSHFVGVGDYTEGLWRMPPAHRKTAEKRGDEADHVVPLPPSAWRVVERMMDLHDDGDENPFLFRGQRPRRAGQSIGSIASSGVQHGMMYSPGITMTPHDVRRGFTKTAGARFKWTLEKCKTILDHNEGRASDDVTVLNYLWDGTHEKWPMMREWCDALEEAAADALQFDARLTDQDWLKRFIVAERDAHKHGVRPAVSLVKGAKIVEAAMPAGTVDLDDDDDLIDIADEDEAA
jgi:hypothetical protein